jgi:hypothetical protein
MSRYGIWRLKRPGWALRCPLGELRFYYRPLTFELDRY